MAGIIEFRLSKQESYVITDTYTNYFKDFEIVFFGPLTSYSPSVCLDADFSLALAIAWVIDVLFHQIMS